VCFRFEAYKFLVHTYLYIILMAWAIWIANPLNKGSFQGQTIGISKYSFPTFFIYKQSTLFIHAESGDGYRL